MIEMMMGGLRSLLVVHLVSVGESHFEEIILPQFRPDVYYSLVSLKSEAEFSSCDHLGGEGNKWAQSWNVSSGEGLSVLSYFAQLAWSFIFAHTSLLCCLVFHLQDINSQARQDYFRCIAESSILQLPQQKSQDEDTQTSACLLGNCSWIKIGMAGGNWTAFKITNKFDTNQAPSTKDISILQLQIRACNMANASIFLYLIICFDVQVSPELRCHENRQSQRFFVWIDTLIE